MKPFSFFFHHDAIWDAHPSLAAGVLHVGQIDPRSDVSTDVRRHQAMARERLALAPEGEWAEIQAWRRAFAAMGLKPTQYRCAAESLSRRVRKEDRLPTVHPLVDLCNALSLAHALPIAVFDLANVQGSLEVRRARGNETHDSFAGTPEAPDAGEVIFADASNHAHARRWCHRQSARSCVQTATTDALIVVEAMHATGSEDIDRLMAALSSSVHSAAWTVRQQGRLSRARPRFERFA